MTAGGDGEMRRGDPTARHAAGGRPGGIKETLGFGLMALGVLVMLLTAATSIFFIVTTGFNTKLPVMILWVVSAAAFPAMAAVGLVLWGRHLRGRG